MIGLTLKHLLQIDEGLKKPLRLHLGCGKRLIYGWVNIDILESVNPDLVEDIFTLPSFMENSVDTLFTAHALEHTGRREYAAALKRWHDVLKPGGVLRIAVPDIHAALLWYLKTGSLRDIQGLLWGGQRDEFDYHCVGWDEKTLTEDLMAAGFQNVRRYNWRETDHFYIDDYSQAMLPHVQYRTRNAKEEPMAVEVSLNLEATKPL